MSNPDLDDLYEELDIDPATFDFDEWKKKRDAQHDDMSEGGYLIHTDHGDVFLSHHGIKGMKWGVRRYQNEDGTLTEAGKKRVSKLQGKIEKQETRRTKLSGRVERQTQKYGVRAGKLNAKAARLRSKEYGIFTSEGKAQELEFRARKLEAKADRYSAKIDLTKARIAKTDALISKYDRKISELDPSMAQVGRDFVEKYQYMKHSDEEDFLAHYGVLGMKWGVRRYQNEDGSLTKAGRKRYYKDWGSSNYSVENLTKRGKKLRKIVLDQADKNRDIIDEYKAQADRLKSVNTNPHAKRLGDDLDKKYDEYKQAKEAFSKSGSEDDRKKLELAFEKLQDAHDTLDAANRRDTDQLYSKYLEKLAEKTLSQLGSDITYRGLHFVEDLIDNYYKTELD